MRSGWLVIALLSGCVVKKYDAASNAASAPNAASASRQGVDFSGVESRIDALISSTEDHDQRDRLIAAADLARDSKRLSPEAQAINLDYLQKLLTVEERNLPYAAPVLSGLTVTTTTGAPVVEEDPSAAPAAPPSGPAPAPAPTPAAAPAPTPAAAPAPAPEPAAAVPPSGPALAPAAMLSASREALATDPQAAMAALEPCRGQPCWDEVSTLWGEARDAYVYKVREEAGARYVASRQIADVNARRAELNAVLATLNDLLVRFPDNKYADAIQRNQGLVAADLAALDKR